MTECPEFLKPRLRLFLSADIIGSTALKQSKLGVSDGNVAGTVWFTAIQGFYFEAKQKFQAAWGRAKSASADEGYFGPAPELWKTIGDEVLFTKLITDHRQVAITLQCWMETLESIRGFLSKEKRRLGVKSTAWIAGFSYRNKEVVLSGEAFSSDGLIDDYYSENGKILNKYYTDSKSNVNIDYIGPHIDTGFRLTGHATARKFIVSLDVAYIMSLTSQTKSSPIEAINLRYDGQVFLKGVLGGTSYPLFWLDLANKDSSSVLEDKLTKEAPCNRDDVQAFCEAFYEQHSELIFPPFVESETENTLTVKPGWYSRDHDALIKSFIESQKDIPEPVPEETEVTDDVFNEMKQGMLDALPGKAEGEHRV